MPKSRLHVVLSQAQGKHPVRRALEESLVAALLMEPGIELAIVPHLYDLDADHPGRLHLGAVRTDMVILSWLYPRAAFWCLDRSGIKGREGTTLLVPAEDDSDDAEKAEQPKGIGALDVPSDRTLYCIDLRNETKVDAFVEEIRRIAAESTARAESKIAAPIMVDLNLAPLKTSPRFTPEQLLTQPGRRWYPVIDYSRCTNCMECIDFCLFGVYGLDDQDRILVESQDACKKGCPACSRVCPEHAIIFPEYKTPAIAGAPVGGIESLKIDLTRLFGGGDAMKIAASERAIASLSPTAATRWA